MKIRNLSRLIWISVALPPDQPAAVQGKGMIFFPSGVTIDLNTTYFHQGPTNRLTPEQLTKRKIYALKLAVAYAYAVKHHLRDENGIHYEDYDDVLPASLKRDGVFGSSAYNSPSMYASYNTYDSKVMRRKSKDSSSTNIETGPSSPIGAGQSRQGARDCTRGHNFHSNNVTSTEAGQHTPLLAEDHHTIELHRSPYEEKLALLPFT